MNFKIGDKVRVVSLTNTKRAFNLDSQGVMKTALNNIYTIEDIYIHSNKESIRLSFLYDNNNYYVWHKNDLQLINSNELEIE